MRFINMIFNILNVLLILHVSSWTFCHKFVKICKTSALRRKVNDPVNENFLSSLHTYKHLFYFLFASSTFCPVFAYFCTFP